MMNIPNDIISLKNQGVTDVNVVDLIKIKGAKEEDIVTHLNDFYTKKNATQVTDKPLIPSNSKIPWLQVIILILLILIASVLGYFILQRT